MLRWTWSTSCKFYLVVPLEGEVAGVVVGLDVGVVEGGGIMTAMVLCQVLSSKNITYN